MADQSMTTAPVPDSKYRPRIADQLLAESLHSAGAVQIVGPKWCGKTTTARRVAREVRFLQDPDKRSDYQKIANEKPSLLLKGEKPLLLDEWQDIPVLWDAVRFAVDREQTNGRYILTGSSVPPEKEIKHSGAGRFSKVVMRTMSLFESGESNGEVSLSDIIGQKEIYARSTASQEELALLIVRGGWPASVVTQSNDPAARVRDYLAAVIESDISRVDNIEKNPKRVQLLMRSLARNESTEAAMTTLRSDMVIDEGELSTNTIAVYLNALRRLYVLDEQEAWAAALRSKTAIRTSPIRRYCDPSIAAALLGASPDKLLNDFNTLGFLFESLCIRDLRIYAESLHASIAHYRDARGLECDAILELPDGTWGAIEVKFGTETEDQAAEQLLTLKKEVSSWHGGTAAFLVILTAGEIAYQRNDGVYVVPLACLKP
ncbi:MAG: DUF4143 domain-containing protein [Coriobacteriia bacterium]|nr:DUF4143 domain-containing protein [Coriobacteriia bacterium]